MKILTCNPAGYLLYAWDESEILHFFAVVRAYYYTSISSVALLSSLSILVCVCGSILFLRARYQRVHFLGIALCLLGAPLLIFNDWFVLKKDTNPYPSNSSSFTSSSSPSASYLFNSFNSSSFSSSPSTLHSQSVNALIGDGLSVLAAICYATSNICCELALKPPQAPRARYLHVSTRALTK